ncbi:MAG: hypothetical protein ACRDPY_32815 [Streptosporangiaceae bacterium]
MNDPKGSATTWPSWIVIMPRPAAPRDEPHERGEPGPVTRLVPHPASVPAQHRVLVPEHQQLGVLRLVSAARQDSQAE